MEGEVEARWAFIGKWEIIPAINKHFQPILELKHNINYRQTIPSKWNVFCEIESITEQAATVINLFIFFFVLKMSYACYFLFFAIIYILSIFCYKQSSLKIQNKKFKNKNKKKSLKILNNHET